MTSELDLGENVKFSISKKFGKIILSRLQSGNAITIDMLKDLRNILVHCQDNEKIRGIILTGEGDSFTTGLDIRSFDASDHSLVKEIEDIAGNITSLLYYGKPVICAINGKAMGDGVIYALASDYRIAVEEAYFQMPEINYAIFPGTGCIVLMTKILGISWTKKMLMFAEKISSEKALEINLIDEIVDNQETLMKSASKKVRFLFTKNQTVLNSIKLCGNHLSDKNYMDAYELEKLGSRWYEFDEKRDFLNEFRRKFM